MITVPLDCKTRVYDEAIQVGENQKGKGMRSSAPLRTKLRRDLVDYSVAPSAVRCAVGNVARPNMMPVSTSTGCPSRIYRLNFH